jgi:hypothetical protein
MPRPITQPIDIPDLIGPDGELDDDAVAAIEASTTDGQLKRVDPSNVPAPAPSPTRVTVPAALGGFSVLVVAVDQFLKANDQLLVSMSSTAGPLIAAVLPLWPVWVPLVSIGWLGANRWQAHQARQAARDATAAATAARQGRQGRAQLRVLQAVVVACKDNTRETKHVGAEVGALRSEFGGLSARLDATDTRTRDDARELRRYVDDRFAALERRLPSTT